jgi:hypothetical protein
MGDVIPLPLAPMPDRLARQVWELSRPPNPAFRGFPVEVYHDPAAKEWLRRKRELLAQRAERDDCHEWFVLLCLGINGITEDAFKWREAAIWEMCQELPAFVWCVETRRTMWARTPFLPAPGECHEVLVAYRALLTREIDALERIANANPAPAYKETPRYVLPRPPEWAFNGPAVSPPADSRAASAAKFEAMHGRAPGALSSAVLAVVRRAAAARSANGLSPPDDPDPPEAAD